MGEGTGFGPGGYQGGEGEEHEDGLGSVSLLVGRLWMCWERNARMVACWMSGCTAVKLIYLALTLSVRIKIACWTGTLTYHR